MTEKRFYYAHGSVWDTKKPNGLNRISINDLDNGLRVVNWLNELADENEDLIKILTGFAKTIESDLDKGIETYPKTLLKYLLNVSKEFLE